MTDIYKPIACALHDEYESAIMRKKTLKIKWIDDGVPFLSEVLPTDILVKNKEEFLVAITEDNKTLSVRLDKIRIMT